MNMFFRIILDYDTLVSEIVAKIPEKHFVSETDTFLDPAFAGGQLLKAVAKRLNKYGHSIENIRSRLFGYEDSIAYLNHPANYSTAMIANLSVVRYMEFINMAKKDFDVILVNAPYQNADKNNTATSLWIPFIEKCCSMADTVATVNPINWLNVDMNKYSFLKNCHIFLSKIYNSKNTPFNGVGIRVGYMLIDTTSNSGITKFIDSDTDEIIEVDLKTSGNLPGNINNIVLSIWKKTMYCENKMGITRKGQLHTQNKELWSETKSEKFCYPLYKSNEHVWSSIKKENYHDIKLIIPEARSHLKSVIKSDCNTSQSAYYVKYDTVSQAENAKDILCSKLFTFLLNESKWGPGLSQSTLENLPFIDVSSTWADNELYAHFDLTQEEIEYIEANVK